VICPGCGATTDFVLTRFNPITREHQAIETWWCMPCIRAKVEHAYAVARAAGLSRLAG
jgi:hypothetical protein